MTEAGEETPLVRNRFEPVFKHLNRYHKTGSTTNNRLQNMIQKAKMKAEENLEDSQAERLADVLKDIENDQKRKERFSWFTLFLILQHVVGGAITLWFLEGWSLFDCFYFCIVTTTTVGYGDITPKSTAAKLYVIYYVIASVAIISAILANIIEVLLDQQEEFLMQNVIQEDENNDLEQGDSRNDSRSRILDATKSLDLEDYIGLLSGIALVIGIVIVGVFVFVRFERVSVVNALYATVISATTVGFGDFQPTSNGTKVFFTVWLCLATLGVGKLVADFTDAHVKMKQRSIARRLLTCNIRKEGLQAMDRNNDGKVEKLEFLTEMLITTGKVEREEVDSILARFNELDKDNDGVVEMKELDEQNSS